jgi:hypothetical protein
MVWARSFQAGRDTSERFAAGRALHFSAFPLVFASGEKFRWPASPTKMRGAWTGRRDERLKLAAGGRESLRFFELLPNVEAKVSHRGLLRETLDHRGVALWWRALPKTVDQIFRTPLP